MNETNFFIFSGIVIDDPKYIKNGRGSLCTYYLKNGDVSVKITTKEKQAVHDIACLKKGLTVSACGSIANWTSDHTKHGYNFLATRVSVILSDTIEQQYAEKMLDHDK